ncbi:hypothetical protein JHW43_006846 [Diplocarpon mali]|nr:hypothetical protein JHW43_006846 [Diplocarpon mali]
MEGGVEVVVRAMFFGLNLIFNGIMWTLFTKALARGTSTTQVSILNTSANFMITAVLGWLIFSESLPPLWFVGAGLLVAGNVIIGRREEGEGEGKEEGDQRGGRDSAEEGAGLLGEELELYEEVEEEERRTVRAEDEGVLQLDPEGSRAGRERLPNTYSTPEPTSLFPNAPRQHQRIRPRSPLPHVVCRVRALADLIPGEEMQREREDSGSAGRHGSSSARTSRSIYLASAYSGVNKVSWRAQAVAVAVTPHHVRR